MKIEYIEAPGYRGETTINICRTVVCDQEAEFAKTLMAQLAIVAGQVDGEDSSGRQKCRLLTPEEIAKRACDVSQAAFKEFEARGWLLAIPLPKVPKMKDEL